MDVTFCYVLTEEQICTADLLNCEISKAGIRWLKTVQKPAKSESRCDGRIGNAEISEEAKFPALVPKNCVLMQGPRSGFLLVGLIEHRRCEISRGETFEIKSPEMPGNTSNFNNHHEVAYSFCLNSYIFNANIHSPSQRLK